jgi:hypothetical protein
MSARQSGRSKRAHGHHASAQPEVEMENLGQGNARHPGVYIPCSLEGFHGLTQYE